MKTKSLVLLIFIWSCAKEADPPDAVLPIPSESQLAWHAMEMNAFVHFTTNTFMNREWGYGDESPNVFKPSAFNAEQWVQTFAETGFKGLVLVCKHHDGFCLWPSELTEHSVKNSKWQGGQGDIVKAVADACKKQGLKFGVYVSPWDRNHKDYGTDAYVKYYQDQLTELFTKYGPIFEMWFDGANGGLGFYGGARDKRSIDGATYYQWPETLEMVSDLEPNVIFFSDAGPGVRWVGNEKGIAGETNWNTITPDTLYAGKAGIENLLNSGSENGTEWIPAEVDVSIRPGWFYHPKENLSVKTPQQLFEIYLTSVGRGSTLLLNVPPDRRGLLHKNDVAALRGFRKLLNKNFKKDLAREATVSSGRVRGNSSLFAASNVADGNPDTYWATNDSQNTGTVELRWKDEMEVKFVILQEYIRLGQRVRSFSVDAEVDGSWWTVAEGTTIGYKRIMMVDGVRLNALRISIKDSKACPVIHSVQVF